MGDTYDSAAEAEADKAQQRALLTALGGWDRALRRDECGAWTLHGKHGSIHTWGDGTTWVLFVACRSPRQWAATKHRLTFCQLLLDCEDEGTFRLHRLPTAEEAETIRDVLGIRKRREVSAMELERLSAYAFERSPRSEASPDAETAGDEGLATLVAQRADA